MRPPRPAIHSEPAVLALLPMDDGPAPHCTALDRREAASAMPWRPKRSTRTGCGRRSPQITGSKGLKGSKASKRLPARCGELSALLDGLLDLEGNARDARLQSLFA